MPPGFAPGGFDCGEQELTEYLCDGSAHRDQGASYSRTYILFDERDHALVGYFSVLTDAIKLKTKERPDGISYPSAPALKLGRMGVDVRYRRQKIGEAILAFVVGMARHHAREIGVRYVTLDALPRDTLINWYERNGFVRNEGERDRDKIVRKHHRKTSIEEPLPHVSMRFDILRESEVPSMAP